VAPVRARSGGRRNQTMQPTIRGRTLVLQRTSTHLVSLLALTLSLIASMPPVPAAAADEVCFTQTNQCISGRFRTFWEQNGGLAIFGYPITPARNEVNPDTGKTYLTQWFERNRFELHPENAAPYDVLLGRLGAVRLAATGRNWQTEDRESGPKAGCLWFPQTGHNVCNQAPNAGSPVARGFMSYWQNQGLRDVRLDAFGRSLALHGLPLTEARQETNSSGDLVLTQWFERARFEWHPNKPEPFKVLLGLLGTEIRTSQPQPPSGLATYVHPSGAWSVRYPADLLQPEDMGNGLTIFISQDRGTVAAIDSYVASGNAYGNTGEDLRNRARDTLERVYGRPVNETDIIARPAAPWETGVSFTTERGSKGEALYEQRGRHQGQLRVNGFLIGYKASTEAESRPRLVAMRDSFQTSVGQASDLEKSGSRFLVQDLPVYVP
jgi:hypothetical protein